MTKDDVKAIISIFIILLLISGLGVLGIYIFYVENSQVEPEKLFQEEVSTILPEDEKEDVLIVQHDDNIANQIASAGNGNQSSTIGNGNQSSTIGNGNHSSTIGNGNQIIQPSTTQQRTQYYYEQLNNYEKLIYDKLKENKENVKTGTYKINFGNSFDELLVQENGATLLQQYYQSGMESYLYDNPDVFYLEPTKMYINIQTTKKVFKTTYEVFIDCGENENYLGEGYTSKEQIEQYEKQIQQEVQKIIAQTTGKSEYEKILTIHDYLVDNVAYEETLSKSNIYNMYGTLVNKESVCEGYAKAFKYLMDRVGVKCVVIIGDATDSNGKNQSHAWNYVDFNNTWYAVDVTWDDPILIGGGRLNKKLKYKYFLKGSNTMNKDHTQSYTFVDNGKVYEHPVLSVSDYN